MRFNEFYNKQRNVLKAAVVKRIESTIPITEERDAFYRGELFSKYDIVESDGKTYTVLEQASNYYQVVDDSGNVSRKFAKQLKKKSHLESINITESFHGYVIKSIEAIELLEKSYSTDCDDVGILKQIKQLDEQMDNSYKSKDKLTVAKIIADAVGVPYDVVSSPDNLVASAIRKAKKDPALMKNKAILANMLQIAKEVGIKITDETFVTESEDLVEYLDKDRHSEYELHSNAAVISNKKYKVKHRKTGKVLSVHNNSLDAVRAMKKAGHSNDTHSIVKESDQLDEVHKLGDRVIMSHPTLKGVIGHIGEIRHGAYKGAPKTYTIDYQHPKHSSHHTSSIQLDSKHFKQHPAGALGESEELDEASTVKVGDDVITKHPTQRYKVMSGVVKKVGRTMTAVTHKDGSECMYPHHDVSPADKFHEQLPNAYRKYDKQGNVVESEQLDELSIGTLKSYSQKAADSATKLTAQGAKAKKVETSYSKFKKASQRLDSKSAADKKVFKKEWNAKVGIKEEVDQEKEELPHGHTMNPSSETHRKQLIKKLTNK